MGSPYILGALYPDSTDVYPVFTQPGGPGTQTFPAQPIGERMGLFNAGCGHWFDAWLVTRSSFLDPDTHTVMSVALVLCPLCQFLQQQIIPYERIYGPEFVYILG